MVGVQFETSCVTQTTDTKVTTRGTEVCWLPCMEGKTDTIGTTFSLCLVTKVNRTNQLEALVHINLTIQTEITSLRGFIWSKGYDTVIFVIGS